MPDPGGAMHEAFQAMPCRQGWSAGLITVVAVVGKKRQIGGI